MDEFGEEGDPPQQLPGQDDADPSSVSSSSTGVVVKRPRHSTDDDGSGRRWEYDPDHARRQLCRFIARTDDVPLNLGESAAFEDYIRKAHNPRFRRSVVGSSSTSRQQTTTALDMAEYYNECRGNLKCLLEARSSSVALSCGVWAGRTTAAGRDQDCHYYLSVAAHFVTNDDWQLEKRTIGFRLIDEPAAAHTGAANVAECVSSVVEEFGLASKVFSVTLDDNHASSAANNSITAAIMDILTPKLNSYAPSFLLHQRCACHVINAVVKSGLKRVGSYLDDFRAAISFVNASNQRIAAYKQHCLDNGVMTPCKFALDVPVRWNSTYFMLKSLLPHRSTFSTFLQTQHHHHHHPAGGQPQQPLLITEDHWYVAEKIHEFLEFFHDSACFLSGVYYPTSPLIMHHMIEVAALLKNHESDALLRDVVVAMKSKFLKYWRQVPDLYAFAFVLDPRAKLKGLSNALQILGEALGQDYSDYYSQVRVKLSQVYNAYETKYGEEARLQQQKLLTSAGMLKRRVWEKLLAMNTSGSNAAETGGGELASYLDSDIVSYHLAEGEEDLNLLQWWCNRKSRYPVLSLLARDVLTVPVSTVSTESAFSLTGRVLEERRANLTSSPMVEMLTVVRDWEQAEARAQHTAENKSLQALFENLYVD